MALTKIAQKKWVYTLYRDEARYVLSVVCGGPAMFELNIELNDEEVVAATESDASLEALAGRIRSAPQSYVSRNVQL